jgi:hypothetical protein
MPHYRKGSGKKRRLYPFLLTEVEGTLPASQVDPPVKVAAQSSTEQGAEGAAEHVAERSTDECSPPGHQ